MLKFLLQETHISFHGHRHFSVAQKYNHSIRQTIYYLRGKNENYRKCYMLLLVKKYLYYLEQKTGV